jgi:hypothetical protein
VDVVDVSARDRWAPGPEVSPVHHRPCWPDRMRTHAWISVSGGAITRRAMASARASSTRISAESARPTTGPDGPGAHADNSVPGVLRLLRSGAGHRVLYRPGSPAQPLAPGGGRARQESTRDSNWSTPSPPPGLPVPLTGRDHRCPGAVAWVTGSAQMRRCLAKRLAWGVLCEGQGIVQRGGDVCSTLFTRHRSPA